mmetsp:Transcript_46922/g.130696  ORF Transcript_46922/g.130696 Transcript_46922/m.130696 type:complete len:549 (-) Transcript_46922:711-2357(-)
MALGNKQLQTRQDRRRILQSVIRIRVSTPHFDSDEALMLTPALLLDVMEHRLVRAVVAYADGCTVRTLACLLLIQEMLHYQALLDLQARDLHDHVAHRYLTRQVRDALPQRVLQLLGLELAILGIHIPVVPDNRRRFHLDFRAWRASFRELHHGQDLVHPIALRVPVEAFERSFGSGRGRGGDQVAVLCYQGNALVLRKVHHHEIGRAAAHDEDVEVLPLIELLQDRPEFLVGNRIVWSRRERAEGAVIVEEKGLLALRFLFECLHDLRNFERCHSAAGRTGQLRYVPEAEHHVSRTVRVADHVDDIVYALKRGGHGMTAHLDELHVRPHLAFEAHVRPVPLREERACPTAVDLAGEEVSQAFSLGAREYLLFEADELLQHLLRPSLRIVLHHGIAHVRRELPPVFGWHLEGHYNGSRHLLDVMRVHDKGIEHLLRSSGELGQQHEPWDDAGRLHAPVLRDDELLCYQVHAVDKRRHEAAVGPRVQRNQLVYTNAVVDVNYRRVCRRGKLAVDLADCVVHVSFHRPVFFHLLPGWDGHEKEHRITRIP